MANRTPLYDRHVAAGAKIVDFGGWDMPLHYGSQKEEHHAVRGHAGVFDVSHMTVVDISGDGATDFLRRLLANDVARLDVPGRALYTCMLNESGGVIDDLIVYRTDATGYRLVVNAATRATDLAWISKVADDYAVTVAERDDLAMIAVQGPAARQLAADAAVPQAQDDALAIEPFNALEIGKLFIARTGYTGEDGWEIIVPAEAAPELWDALVAAGAAPCGLAARDTLRLEAGMNLYGNDMDETITPLEAGLGWTVAWDPADRDFIGRERLERQRGDSSRRRFVGLLLEDRGVLRDHQRIVVDCNGEGEVTSGGYSPTLGRSIALARVPAGDYEHAQVDLRGTLKNVRIVRPPFVRNGRIRIELDTAADGR